jgi:hypothetical protein
VSVNPLTHACSEKRKMKMAVLVARRTLKWREQPRLEAAPSRDSTRERIDDGVYGRQGSCKPVWIFVLCLASR